MEKAENLRPLARPALAVAAWWLATPVAVAALLAFEETQGAGFLLLLASVAACLISLAVPLKFLLLTSRGFAAIALAAFLAIYLSVTAIIGGAGASAPDAPAADDYAAYAAERRRQKDKADAANAERLAAWRRNEKGRARAEAARKRERAAAAEQRKQRTASAAARQYWRCHDVGRTSPRHAAETFVRGSLKNPKGATFSGYGETQIAEPETCDFIVIGWVDATNGFNAVIRSKYAVSIRHESDRWSLLEIAFD